MRGFIILFIVSTINIVSGQDFDYHRDFKKIQKESTKPNSKLNYNTLLERFIKADTTLTPYEVLALQIGFTTNAQYKPYQNVDIERTYIKSVHNNKSDTCILYGTSFVKRNPVGLAINYALYKAYEAKDNTEKAESFRKRYFMLVNAILFSGDGDKKPYFVLSPIDGQTLITEYWQGTLGQLMGSSIDKYENLIDVLEMEKDGQTITKKSYVSHAMDTYIK
jgi:hypothetical protein